MVHKIVKIQTPFLISTEKKRTIAFQVASDKGRVSVFSTHRFSKITALFFSIFTPMLQIDDAKGKSHFIRKKHVVTWIKSQNIKEPLKRGIDITDALNRLYIEASAGEDDARLDHLPKGLLEIEVLRRSPITELLRMRGFSPLMRARIDRSPLWEEYANELKLEEWEGMTSLDYKEAVLKDMRSHLKYARGWWIIPPLFFSDRGFVLKYLEKDSFRLTALSPSLRDDKEVVLKIVRRDASDLKNASDRLKDDKEFILEIVKNQYHAFDDASDRLKDDEEVALAALKAEVLSSSIYTSFCSYVLSRVSKRLLRDEKFILEAIKVGGLKTLDIVVLWKLINADRFNDKEFILEIVKRCGLGLQYASDGLKDDKGVVLEAVKRDGDALEYASDGLKDDKDVVLEAVKADKGLRYERNDGRIEKIELHWKNFKGGILIQHEFALCHASDRLKDDKEVVLEAVRKNAEALEDASDRLKDDEEVVLTAVCQNGRTISVASERLQDNLKIALAAVRQDPEARRYLSKRMQLRLRVRSLIRCGK